MNKINVRVYTGKFGCMCGCRGNYSRNPSVISHVRNIMTKNFEHVVFEEGLGNEQIAAVEVNGRAYVAYVEVQS